MARNVCAILKTFIIASIVLGTGVSVVHSQNNQNIYIKYCTVTPHDICFNPIDGAIDTVGRDVFFLAGDYRFCLDIDSINFGVAPVRVMLVIDESGSMCRNYGDNCCTEGDGSGECAMNDSANMRVAAANRFIDSLRVISPNSEVGVLRYSTSVTGRVAPLSLNSEENVAELHAEIEKAGCSTNRGPNSRDRNDGIDVVADSDVSDDVGLAKVRATKVTNLGNALELALEYIDTGYENLSEAVRNSRHIILLTDGAWDDNASKSPDVLYQEYTTTNPDRKLPIVHGIFLSDSARHVAHGYPAEGCAQDSRVDFSFLEAATKADSQGIYIPGSTPETIIEKFRELLQTMIRYEAEQLKNIVVTNSTNGEVREQASINTVPSTVDKQAHYTATLNKLPLEFGTNTLIFEQVIQKPGVEETETITSTVTIFRTTDWTSTINAEEYSQYCEKDSTTITISVTPPFQMINTPFNVTATIALKEMFILDTAVMRIFTANPDVNDNSTIALFHLDGDLTNSIGNASGTGDMVITTESVLFGSHGANRGSLSYPVGSLDGDFAFEVWLKPSSAVSQTELFSNSSLSLSINPDRYLILSSAGNVISQSAQPVDVGVWSHIAIARASGYVYLFINGSTVSAPISFAHNVTGVITVSVPDNCALDEIKAGSVSRLVTMADGTVRFAVASLSDPTWTATGGAPAVQPELVIPPTAWNGGVLQLTFSSPVPGKCIVNMSHRGTEFETLWSKNGNPVTVGADLQGPYVKNSIFTRGNFGTEFDTLDVVFTEPVSCDSLKKGSPAASFEIYDSLSALKPDIFTGAEYLNLNCSSLFINDVRIIVKTMLNGITPRKDSIKLIGIVVDTAGNYPDSILGPINYGPGSGLKLYAMENDRDPGKPPMTINKWDANRLGIPNANRRGKLFILTTKEKLTTWGTAPDDGTPNYAQKTLIFDATGNVVASDVPLKRSGDDERMYYVVWNGMNKNNRRVSTGAYLFRAYVMYVNDMAGKIVSKQTKFSVDWGRVNKF